MKTKKQPNLIRPKTAPVLYVIEGVSPARVCEPETPKTAQLKNQPPRKPTNRSQRERQYLTKAEVMQLVEAAKKTGRYSKRDSAAVLMAYRHGLRAVELVGLQWQQIDFANGRIHINRCKNGDASVQPLQGDALTQKSTALNQRTLHF
jgi:integrase